MQAVALGQGAVDMFGTKRVRSAVSCGQHTQELVLTRRGI